MNAIMAITQLVTSAIGSCKHNPNMVKGNLSTGILQTVSTTNNMVTNLNFSNEVVRKNGKNR